MKKLICLIALFNVLHLNSQTNCATDYVHQQLIKKHPEIQEMINAQTNERLLSSPNQTAQSMALSTFSVPIVVHVMHDYGPENITDNLIINAINQLNLDFSGTNADLANVIPQFTSAIGIPSLVFVPARLDPSGNCTNGIDRFFDERTYATYAKPNQWPPSKYLNIWVVNAVPDGKSGYASPPPQPMSDQGVVVRYNAFNAISRTPTHEVGHFYNLLHTFQGGCNNNNCNNDNDEVCDTPPTTENNGCPNPAGAVNCGTILSNYQNFMDYTSCGLMFTNGQVNRMGLAATSTVGARSSLISPTTAIATGINLPLVLCPPKMDFSPGYLRVICAGDSVKFEDLTFSGSSASRTWQFQGGSITTSSNNTLFVTYNTPGLYSCTLIAQNAAGTNTLSRSDLIKVLPSTTTFSNSFIENFESISSFTNNWTSVSKSHNEWQFNTQAAYTGTSCVAIQNKSSYKNETDRLLSPAFNLSLIQNPKLTFARAFARIDTSKDELRVLATNNCGKTWLQIYSKKGAGLATTNSIIANFVPTNVSEWKADTIDLAPIASQTNVRFAFLIENDNGNNIYLDDINVFSGLTSGISSSELPNYKFQLYPNPSNGSFIIDLPVAATIRIENSLGQLIYSAKYNMGRTEINLSTIPKGMYFIYADASQLHQTQKVIVQ